MKTLSAFVLLITGVTWGITPSMAETASSPSGQTAKKASAKKTSVTKSDAHAEAEDEPDIKGLIPTAFNCELGNKLTIYHNENDDQQVALHWNKHLHRMTRVGTSTGAQRFENSKKGLVWIGIPAKGMLLDSKKGQQLANECKTAEQATEKISEQKLGIAK